jgi:hypothetical protein
MNTSSHCQLCDNQIVSLTSGTTCFLTKQKPLFSKRCPQISLNEKFEDKLVDTTLEYETIKQSQKHVYTHSVFLLLVSLIFMIGGYLFGGYIWDKGLISTVPLLIIGVGLSLLAIALKPFSKYRNILVIARDKKDKLDKILKLYGIKYAVDLKFGKQTHGVQDVQINLKLKKLKEIRFSSKTSEKRLVNGEIRSEKKQIKKRIHNHLSLQFSDFERFILFKGDNFPFLEEKVREYPGLYTKQNTYTYIFFRAKLAGWDVLKIPPTDMWDDYAYQDLVHWCVDYPLEDENYGDKVIGISIRDQGKQAYILYSDYEVEERLNLEDGLLGVFNNNEKFTLIVPFNEFGESEEEKIKTYEDLLTSNQIDLTTIINDKLNFEEFSITIRE